MEKLVLLAITALLSCNLFAQETEEPAPVPKEKNDEIRTLVGPVKSFGGYLGLTANYSQIDNRDAILVGGRLGWLMNHVLTVGVCGYAFANDYRYDNSLNANADLTGGYGGFFFEPIIAPKFPVHVSFPILLGAGGIARTSSQYDYHEHKDQLYYDVSDYYLMVEPGAEVELNMLKFFRIALGVTYRYTSSVSIPNTSGDVLNGLNAGITFKFGKF